MKHPHSSKVYEIAETLDFVATTVCNKVDMRNIDRLERSHGRPCCYGGWFEYASSKIEEPYRSYRHGVFEIVMHLGFKDNIELMKWADENPRVWGNVWGKDLFSSLGARAFGKTNKTLTLKDIANHWYEVAGRLKEMEER